MYELFSNLLIDQLQKHVDRYPVDAEGEKWLVGYYGNKSLNKTFENILALCNDVISLDINGKKYDFKVWRYNDKTIIPCRVKNNDGQDYSEFSPNYCTREFNGKLRDFFFFKDGNLDPNRILLTLDNEPMETQKASRILTAPRQPLHYTQLIKGIEQNITKDFNKTMQKVTKSVLNVWMNEVEIIEEDQLEEILKVLKTTQESSDPTQLQLLGKQLTNLDIFLPANGKSEGSFSEKNLKANMKLKKELDKLYSPEVLIEKELEENYDAAFAEKLIGAYRTNERSLYEFTYEELTKNKLKEIEIEEKLKIVSISFDHAVIVKEQTETNSTNFILKVGHHRNLLKVYIEFNREFSKESIYTFTGSSGIKIHPMKMVGKIIEPIANNTAQLLVNIDSIKVGHYGFCSIDVKSGTKANAKSISEIKLAIVKAEEDRPVFYEQGVQFEVQYQAFTVSGLDDVICILENEDRQHEEEFMVSDINEPISFEGTRRLRFQDIVHGEGTYVTLRPSWEGQEFYLPLWLEPSGEEEFTQEVHSIFEMLLEDRKQFIREQNGSQKWLRPDLRIDGETIYLRGKKQSLGPEFSKYLSIERKILQHPSILIWRGKFGVDIQSVNLRKHPLLEDLPSWNSEIFYNYLHSREHFFVRLQEKGINSLLLTFLSQDEEIHNLAKQYVNSYVKLCKEILY